MSDVVLLVENLHRTYKQAESALRVLHGVSFTVKAGEMVALMGQSGSGKSTLLHCVGLLDHPDQGSISISGYSTAGLNERERTAMRQEIGQNRGFRQ